MFDIYTTDIHACNHIGCCVDAEFKVEAVEAGKGFVTVCQEHADFYGSNSWTRDYNTARMVTTRPERTEIFNTVRPPVFNPNIEITVF